MEKEIVEVRDINLGAFLLAKGFDQVSSPKLDSNKYHLVRTFLNTPELQKEFVKYYRHECLVEPTHFVDNIRATKNLAIELRKIAAREDGDL